MWRFREHLTREEETHFIFKSLYYRKNKYKREII